jgi:uncharacterized protein YndB with AHSA1/START domain
MSSDRPDPSGPSNDAVLRATGRRWDDWFAALDRAGANELDHRSIVALLRDREGLDEPWWQQTVTVAYEKARGLRAEVGQTADAGFQVGVRRTVDLPAEAAWSWLLDGPGRRVWLGPCPSLTLEPGATYACEDGTRGEVRSVRPGERVRLTWHPPDLDAPSTLQLTVTPKDGRCVVAFHQEKLPGLDAREAMKVRWRAVLAELAAQA